MRILVVAVGGLSVLATGRVAAQPGPTAPMNVAVPAATGDPDEPGTRSDSTPEEVCVAPLADIDVNRTSGGKHRNRKSLRIGPWSSMGSTGSTGTDSCTMQVAEQAVNTAEGMAVGAVYLSGVTTCRSGSSSSGAPRARSAARPRDSGAALARKRAVRIRSRS